MTILPSAEIRQRYNEVAEICKTTKEPVYLTRNGQGDLVVMDIETFERMKQEIALKEMILQAHAAYLSGAKTHSLEETFAMIDEAVKG
ncbi:MAG: type II toxin-antitoxin system Phd/YefM family antitoxin [Erysipelotrichaceae bacterium]|jgi:prevent-host-death family protein|nr:type II toxin-antitoxin system Phd/YefM family antitoxin [Erysipelotrichaceae bacterium]